MLEARVKTKHKFGIIKLQLDAENGHKKNYIVSAPFISERTTKRLFLLDYNPSGIRVSLPPSTEFTSLEHFRIAKVHQLFALNRMLKKLSGTHPQFIGKSHSQIRSRLRGLPGNHGRPFIEVLYEVYNTLFEQKTRSVDYPAWIEQVEKPGLPDPVQVRDTIEAFSRRPLISVALPVYNSDKVWLKRCIQSVIGQPYPHWELCIADDASSDPAIRDLLTEQAAHDARIKLVFRTENGHISAATNSALELCSGKYITFLDHDDELSEHALFFVAKAINDNPAARLFYSDEDKLDSSGLRFNPHFKPDWNPDLLFSQNYIAHLAVIATDLVRKVGGLRTGVEGSQDHDLLLRCVQHIQPSDIVHIPRILYHWRAQRGSTADSPDSKNYTTTAGIRALTDHFTAMKIPATVEPGIAPNTYRVRYPLPPPPPRVSILVPTRDGADVLKTCIESLLKKTTYPDYEILVIDNQSTDPDALEYLAHIAAQDHVRIVRYNEPFNYSAINNFGVGHARGEILCLLNNDTEVITGDWLTEMVSHACRPEIGCVGAKLLYPDGTIQHAGIILGIGGVAGHSHKYAGQHEFGYFTRLHLVQNFSAVTGACLVVRKDIYEQVGGLNEKDLPVSFNDVDFCLRVRQAGYRNLWTPYAELYHHESASRGIDAAGAEAKRATNEAAYMRKAWGKLLYNDPAYNPNLSLLREDFSLSTR